MKPYNQTESKEQVRTMFDGIARRYDLLNHCCRSASTGGWRRRVVRMVRLHRPAEILDMATGTGDLAIMLAEACPAAQITGIDLSERMLAIGREKVERKGLSGRIRLSQETPSCPDTAKRYRRRHRSVRRPQLRRLAGRNDRLVAWALTPGKAYVLEFGMPQKSSEPVTDSTFSGCCPGSAE